MYETFIGIAFGLIIRFFVIAPIERKKNRDWCIKRGLVPKDMDG